MAGVAAPGTRHRDDLGAGSAPLATSQLRGLLRHRRPRSHRRRSRWRIAAPAVVLVLVSGLTLAGGAARPPDPPYPPGPLPIATGAEGTVYYSYGYGLADAVKRSMPGLRPYLMVSPGTRTSLARTNAGKTKLGFASADTIASLPSAGTEHLATLARLYDDYLHLVVRRDGEIEGLSDLVGRRVSVGPPDSSTARTVKKLLYAADIAERRVTLRHLGLEGAATALLNDKIDAFFFFGGLPTSGLDRLEPFKLIDLAEWVPKLRRGYGSFYSQVHIPPSVYGGGMEPVTTVGIPTYLVVPTTMDQDLAYALTAMLFEQRATMAKAHPVAERLDRRAAINTLPLRLHPGAARYYRDAKI